MDILIIGEDSPFPQEHCFLRQIYWLFAFQLGVAIQYPCEKD